MQEYIPETGLAGANGDAEALSRFAPGGIFTYSAEPDESFAFISSNMLDLLGYTREEFLTKFEGRFSRMVWHEDRARVLAEIEDQISRGPFDTCEYRIEKKDGSIVWVHDEGHIVRDSAGKRWFYVVIVDITDSVRDRQLLLRRNRELASTIRDLQTTVDSIPGGIRVFRMDGHTTFCVNANQYYADMLGVRKEELIGESFEANDARLHPEDLQRHRREMLDELRKNRRAEGTYRYFNRHTGMYRWYYLAARIAVQPDGSDLAYLHYSDVDDLKRAEDSMADSRRRYELAIKGANLAVWEYDIAAHRLVIPDGTSSAFARERYGFTSNVVENVPECMLSMGLRDEDRKNFLALFEQIRAGQEYASAEIWFRKASTGEPCCDRISYYVRKDAEGRPVQAYGVGSDITAEQREQMKFHESIQAILSANPESLCTFQLNLTRNLCYEGHGISPYILRSLQADTADGLFANALRIVTCAEDREKFAALFDRDTLLAQFAAGRTSVHLDYRRNGENGVPYWARTFLSMLQNPETGDVEGVIFSVDVSREVQQNEIFRILTGAEYDFIALLHLDTGEVEALHLNASLPESYGRCFCRVGAVCSFEALRRTDLESWVDEEDRKKYREGTEIAQICASLDRNGQYDLTVRGSMPGRGAICRKLQHYYLNDFRRAVLLIDSDVTEMYRAQQKELQAAQAEAVRVRDIMDSITAGISVLHMPDADHVSFEYVNRQLFSLLHFTAYPLDGSLEGQIGDPMVLRYIRDGFTGVHPDDLARVKKTFHDHYDSALFTVEDYRTLGGDGQYHWLRQEVRLRETTPDYRVFYATYRDVTEEMRLRQERDRQLEEEKELRMEATAANEAKSDFLSRMSHDIRTPLNGIIGMAYLASRESNPHRTADCLAKIDTASKFLLGLINDILDMSRAESKRIELHPEPYPAGEFRAYLEAVIQPLCQEKEQNFTMAVETPADRIPVFDKLRINQVVFNLLSNAVKYTPEGGSVRYEAVFRPAQAAGHYLLKITISDTGIGMSESFQKILFEPFVQEGRSDSSERRGSGLGLAIAKRMIDLMGGKIAVESQIGRGTTFTVEMEVDSVPAARGPAADPPQGQEDLALLAGRHVLLCEDHPLNQEIAQQLLADKKMIVDIAENGQMGLEKFARASVGYYDVVLMDIRMPVMNGYDAVRALRALRRPDAAVVPVIAMTADAFSDDVQRCLDCGMNGHLAKPIDPAALYKTLDAVLRGQKKPPEPAGKQA